MLMMTDTLTHRMVAAPNFDGDGMCKQAFRAWRQFTTVQTEMNQVHYFSGFTGMCVDHVPSPAANAKNKVQHVYTGPMDTELAESMCQCDPDVR